MAKLDALTGLRFFAAVGIAVLHARGALGVPSSFPDEIVEILLQGVPFFFVLSGFILTYKYPDLNMRAARGRFIWARFARLWPAHIVALLLMLALNVPYWGGAPEAFANVLMIHAWLPWTHTFFSFNAVSWSISTEFAFYLLFPFLIRDFERSWHWKLATALALCIGMQFLCLYFRLPEHPDQGIAGMGLYYTNPLARLFEFVTGMTAALMWRRYKDTLRIGLATGTMLELASIMVLVSFGLYCSMLSKTFGIAALGAVSPITFAFCLYTALAAALVISVFACRTGYLSRLLGTRSFVFLGEISFSIYLVHQPLRTFFAMHEVALTSVFGNAILIVYAATVLATATTSWRLVERTARKMLLSLQGCEQNSGVNVAKHA
jgi:peptidoglycan/LPS O-acetylase OafA/YrhL